MNWIKTLMSTMPTGAPSPATPFSDYADDELFAAHALAEAEQHVAFEAYQIACNKTIAVGAEMLRRVDRRSK